MSLHQQGYCRKRTGSDRMVAGRDVWLDDELAKVDTDCEPVSVDGELFYSCSMMAAPANQGLYSSAGYLLYTNYAPCVFDYRDGDIYACVADVGWITGHSYIVYGPLANGATTVMFDIPTYPDCGRYWDMVERRE